MAETNEPICSICRGKKSEHGPDTIHVFTQIDGDLMSKDEKAKAATVSNQSHPMRLQVPGADPMITRLLEVLMDKGLFNTHEVLYVVGVGAKPAIPIPSGYADPNMDGGS